MNCAMHVVSLINLSNNKKQYKISQRYEKHIMNDAKASFYSIFNPWTNYFVLFNITMNESVLLPWSNQLLYIIIIIWYCKPLCNKTFPYSCSHADKNNKLIKMCCVSARRFSIHHIIYNGWVHNFSINSIISHVLSSVLFNTHFFYITYIWLRKPNNTKTTRNQWLLLSPL
jgi:hypothetical protein